MKKAYYFSHDYGARNDEKITKLLQQEGWEGYGLFWALIEKLYENDGFLDEDYKCIAFDLRTECERIERLIKEYKLFKIKNGSIYSDSVLHRLRQIKGRSEKARQSAFLRWDKQKKSDANAKRTQSEGYAVNKIKEIKEISTNVDKEFGNSDVNWLIGEFEKIRGFKSAGGAKDRVMAKHLLNNFSKEQLTVMLKHCETQYAPRVGSVVDLWFQRGKIIAGIKAEKKTTPNTNNSERLLHDGSRAIKKFGQWYSASQPDVKIDLHFYPELLKD